MLQLWSTEHWRASGGVVQRHFGFVVDDGCPDAANLLSGQFRKEQMGKAGVLSKMLGLVDRPPDKHRRDLRTELPRELNTNRLLERSDQVGKRSDAGSANGARALDRTCFHWCWWLIDQSSTDSAKFFWF